MMLRYESHRLDGHRERPRRLGFTLVELLVVVPIIGILVALLLAPRLSSAAFDLHFDYTSFDNPGSPGADPHFGQAQFDVLNYPSINGNYMMTSTDNHRPEMVANGNDLAEFYNFLQARYNEQTVKNGAAAADAINQYTVNNSARNGPRPDWLILNEISASLWPPNAGPPGNSIYRTWLLDCVTRLHEHYGYNVVTLAPFQNPGANDASWQALAEVSYIGIECYLSGTEIWNSGTDHASRLAWAQSQYQASKNSYLNRGVRESRLFVTEHFANNTAVTSSGAPVGWGRAGLPSAADWDTVIQIRQDAIYNVAFAGFLAYAWGGNAMGITQAEQIQHEYYYRSRLVLPTQKPQWLSDQEINVNGITVPLSWSQRLNWLGEVPNAIGAEANFWRTLTADRTITLDGFKTVGKLTLDSPFSYTITPGTGGSLVVNDSDGVAEIASNQGSHTIGVNVELVDDLSAAVNFGVLTISGIVSGAGDLVKSGSGTLVLTHTDNSYTGITTVEQGTLQLSSHFLHDSASVSISSVATLQLDFSGMPDVIDSLFIDGVRQPAGIWGPIRSMSQFTSPLITGTGRLEVLTGPLAGDYNHNGVVVAADYVVWRDSGDGPEGYLVWRQNFGASFGSSVGGPVAAVPEPAACWLLGVAMCLAAGGRLAGPNRNMMLKSTW